MHLRLRQLPAALRPGSRRPVLPLAADLARSSRFPTFTPVSSRSPRPVSAQCPFPTPPSPRNFIPSVRAGTPSPLTASGSGQAPLEFRITAFSPHHFSSSPFISHSLPLPSVPPQGFPSPPSLLSFSLTDFCLSFKTNGTLWGSRSLTDLSIPAHCPQASLSDIL